MNCYRVTWGVESKDVYAADENEAWAQFADGNELAARHPKSNERTVKLVEPKAVKDEPAPKKTFKKPEGK